MPKIQEVNDGKCLCGCGQKAAVQCKGLSMKCWGKAKKLIESGKTTLAELENLGMVAAEPSAFEKELERRRASSGT